MKLLRGYRSLSREQLAESVGVVGTTLARFEQGERLPRPRLLALIARVLDVPVSALQSPISLTFAATVDGSRE